MTEPLPGFRPPDDPHDPTTWRYPESAQVEPESAKAQYAVGGIIFALIAVLVGLLWATGAFAQTRQACAKRDQVVRKLEEKFGETLRSIGLHQSDGVVEVYSSEETGTWTILVTRPDGMSCLMASGQFWEPNAAALVEKPKGDPT